VLSIEPLGLDGTQEELTSVGSWSGVGHRKDTGSSVLKLKVLVLELVAVDGFSTSSVVVGEVSSLTNGK
jgi:hypothetical protein